MLEKITKVVCIFAHPDDESFGPSGTIAKYADVGEVYVICVTDGDDLTNGKVKNLPQRRTEELKASAKVLGVKKVFFLNYKDGELSNNKYHEVSDKVEKILEKIKPDTLLTFEPRGISGHIDHVFCSLITSFLFRKLEYIKILLYAVARKEVTDKMKDYFIYFPPGYTKNEVDMVSDVSKYWDLKVKAVNTHESQDKDKKRILKWLKTEPKEEYFLVLKKK